MNGMKAQWIGPGLAAALVLLGACGRQEELQADAVREPTPRVPTALTSRKVRPLRRSVSAVA